MDMLNSRVVELQSDYDSPENKTKPILIDIKGSLNPGKTLKYSPKVDNLFVNIDDVKILIFANFTEHYKTANLGTSSSKQNS